MSKYLYIVFFTLFFSGCKKSDKVSVDYYYNYFPLAVNSWVEYDVIDITHSDFGSDTLNYQLKELITEEFLDNSGRLTYRVERFMRESTASDWVIKDVWYANRTKTTAEKIEENVRFTKMIFPVNTSKYWNGNAFNLLKKWEYSYDSLHTSKTINSLVFDSTITVIQRDNQNVVEYEKAFEIYAVDIGLVYKKHVDLNINLGDSTNINDGVELEMTVRSYGK